MNVDQTVDHALSRIASAIGEPARARMLCSLLDGHARTSTELAVIGEVSPSTASVHLSRLKQESLVRVSLEGKHRYYSLEGSEVASVLEALSVLAGSSRKTFVPNTPVRLRVARTCYDHIAGSLGVALYDSVKTLGWLSTVSDGSDACELTQNGVLALEKFGIDVAATRALRRRFAYACLDWSERRAHLGGAVGAALLELAMKRKWVTRNLDSRALEITSLGKREWRSRFGINL
jgi:DNA-binding transcriptional ArsR family regulator